MGTSSLRFAIVVAMVVGGVLLIDQAFTEDPGGLPRRSPSPSGTESPTPTSTPDTPDGSPAPQIEGVALGVYNGTPMTGLAGSTAEQLVDRFGYVVPNAAVGDTPSKPVNQTTLYFRSPEDEIEAEALAANFFAKRGLTDVKIVRMPGDLETPDRVQVAIYIGTDYVRVVGQG